MKQELDDVTRAHLAHLLREMTTEADLLRLYSDALADWSKRFAKALDVEPPKDEQQQQEEK